jgi:hypothetical protein
MWRRWSIAMTIMATVDAAGTRRGRMSSVATAATRRATENLVERRGGAGTLRRAGFFDAGGQRRLTASKATAVSIKAAVEYSTTTTVDEYSRYRAAIASGAIPPANTPPTVYASDDPA